LRPHPGRRRPWMTPPPLDDPAHIHTDRCAALFKHPLPSVYHQLSSKQQQQTTMTHIVDFTRADFNQDYYTSSWSHSTASSQAAIDERWNLLSNFVKTICANRDDSHTRSRTYEGSRGNNKAHHPTRFHR
jgi:hypothetical protein